MLTSILHRRPRFLAAACNPFKVGWALPTHGCRGGQFPPCTSRYPLSPAIIEHLEIRQLLSSTFLPPGTYTVPSAVSVAAADLNGDGKRDLIAVDQTENLVKVLLNNGDGTFAAPLSFGVGNHPQSVAVADFNGDGRPDLAVTSYDDKSVTLLFGNGDGTFGAPHILSDGPGPGVLIAGDFNGDGKADLVSANKLGSSLTVLIGNGNGTFKPAATVSVGTAPYGLAAADINGDHKLDLISSNFSDNTVSILLGNGNGTFKPQKTFAVGNGPRGVIAADVNGDHKLDLIAANSTDYTVSVLIGNGDGTFKAQHASSVGNTPYSVAAADFNGDGKADLIAANYNANANSELIGNGDGTFQAQTAIANNFGARDIITADLNNDGRMDVVTANFTSGSLIVLLHDGTGAASTEAPVITSSSSATLDVANPGTFTVAATGFPAPALRATGLPSGVTFTDHGNGTATIGVGANTKTAGIYHLKIFASAGKTGTATQSFMLAVDHSPAITSLDHATFTVGVKVSFTVRATGFPLPVLTFPGLPAGLVFTDKGRGTGLITGAPLLAAAGTSSLTLTAANLSGSTHQTFSLTVIQPPKFTNTANGTFTVGIVGTFTFNTTGFPTSVLSTGSPLPSGLIFTDKGNGAATLTGSPAVGTGGVSFLKIQAAQSTKVLVNQSFTLAIQEGPKFTSANGVNFSTNRPSLFNITTTGLPKAIITLKSGSLPFGLHFVDNGNGTATIFGTPTFIPSSSTLTIQASNGIGPPVTQTFTLIIQFAYGPY